MSDAEQLQLQVSESTDHYPKPRVQTAVRTVSVLLAISANSDGLKAKEISAQLNIPRQVTYHLLHSLLSTGIIRKNSQNRYVLGLAVASIAEGFRRQLEPSEALLPKVRAVVAATGETSYASGWVDGHITILATEPGRYQVRAAEVPCGYSGFAHARATGKLLLALSPPRVRETYLATNPLRPLTKQTITSQEDLIRELEKIAEQGYGIDNEELTEGLCCLAVPIGGLSGSFALGISAPTERFRENFENYLKSLKGVANEHTPVDQARTG